MYSSLIIEDYLHIISSFRVVKYIFSRPKGCNHPQAAQAGALAGLCDLDQAARGEDFAVLGDQPQVRTDTVLQQIGEVHQKTRGGPSFHADVEKALLGAIIITRYNNKTNRKDEIAWDKKPTDEFEGRNEEKMTYICPAITRALRKYNDFNREMPQRIILYR